MSGFCGFIGESEETVLYYMVNMVNHCATEEITLFNDGYIKLGYVPYIDEDKHRVAHNENFTVWVMVDAGCNLKSCCADELIRMYEKRGIAFLEDLEGSFSLVLWDAIRQKLYLARDRFGGRPLYYAKAAKEFVFATEMNAILANQSVQKSINYSALYQYLSHQSIYLPNTAFEEIMHIPPGCYGVYSVDSIEFVKYCDMPFGVETQDDYETATDKLTMLLKNSVKKYCYDDMGIFLSGGLDSGVVAALAKEEKIKYSFHLEMKTKKDNASYRDDKKYAEKLAKQYGWQHYTWELDADTLVNMVDDVIKAFAQPFAGTMSTYFLSKKAKGICGNVLSGDGADELFGGYRHHSILLPLVKYNAFKNEGKNPFGNEQEFKPYDTDIQLLENLSSYMGESDTFLRYRLLLMTDKEKGLFLKRDIFGKYFEKNQTLQEMIRQDEKRKSKGVLNQSLERDILYLLPGHTMLYTDALSRTHGLVIGTPYLDKELVDYVITLPEDYKMKNGVTKAILKNVGDRFLQKDLVEREKVPFSQPITEWMKEELKEYVTDILSTESIVKHGVLNPECTEYVLGEYYKKPMAKSYYGHILWTMVMLERWVSIYM